MALPKQVQAQLKEVEELEKTLKTQGKTETETETDEVEVVEVDEKAEDTKAKEPEPKEDSEPEKAKPADTPPTDVADDFEQKYKTLRGKYDAEVPRLYAQVKELSDKLTALEEKANSEPAEEPTKAKEKVSYVTDADRAEFGEELIDVQRRVAKEVSQEYEDRLEAQNKLIKELAAKVDSTGHQVGDMTFAQKLHRLVPDFEQVDSDPRWIEWLSEHDPMLRGPRRLQAQRAFDAGDADAVADYVKLFRQTITETPKPEKDERKAELEKQVAPSRSANTARTQNAGREAKVYSTKEVDAAWTKIRTLNTRGQTDEADKLEAEITAAYLEGRVR